MQEKNKPEIIYEDAFIVAVNKPSGLLSIPDRENKLPSVKSQLAAIYGNIFTVHRLDKDTSGLIVFAKDEKTHAYLNDAFSNRKVEKYYLGIVKGRPPYDSGTIEAAIAEHPVKKGVMYVHRAGKASSTGYEVIGGNHTYALVRWLLHTGRTHQIRVHAKELGCPIACDPIYGDSLPIYMSSVIKNYKLSKREEEEQPLLNRLTLHAFELKLKHVNGKELVLQAPMPKTFSVLMKQIAKG